MTWLVDWNGKEYDIDPGEFTGRELSEIKSRAGFTYRDLMTEALPAFDADAIRAVFAVSRLRCISALPWLKT
jgi:phage tail tube protein FII